MVKLFLTFFGFIFVITNCNNKILHVIYNIILICIIKVKIYSLLLLFPILHNYKNLWYNKYSNIGTFLEIGFYGRILTYANYHMLLPLL